MTSIVYDRKPCGRCGGSGHYSYNQINGTTCFGCGGSGRALTKRGLAAKALADSLLEIDVADFATRTGRRARFTCSIAGKRYTFSTVREELDPAKLSKRQLGDEWIPMRHFDIILDGKPVYGLGEGIKVRLIPTEAEVAQVMEFQAGLNDAGKPRSM